MGVDDGQENTPLDVRGGPEDDRRGVRMRFKDVAVTDDDAEGGEGGLSVGTFMVLSRMQNGGRPRLQPPTRGAASGIGLVGVGSGIAVVCAGRSWTPRHATCRNESDGLAPSVNDRTDRTSSNSATSEGWSSSLRTSLLLEDDWLLSRASVEEVASSRPNPSLSSNDV
jgi:hypothetical protein